MEIINHNIENEKKLIELLGYYLDGPDNSNRWIIWNSEKKQSQYGYIQYKRLYGSGTSKIYGYEVVIDSPKVKTKYTKEYSSNHDTYKLKIINSNLEDADCVEIAIGECPRIIVRSPKYGYMDFHIDYNGFLYLRFSSVTDKFNISETINFQNTSNYKGYTYTLEYCKKNHEWSLTNSKWKTTREIRGVEKEDGELEFKKQTWVHGHLRNKNECMVLGTVEEMVKMHEMGINAFEHFRYIINEIIPSKDDVLSKIVSRDLIERKGLLVFFPSDEFEKEEGYQKEKA